MRATTAAPVPTDGDGPARNAALSLRRGLRLLDCIADRTRSGAVSVSLSVLAAELGTSKSTVLRLTAPMLENDLLRRTADAGFTLGLGALLLGQSYLEGIDLRSAAAPFLRRTAEQTGLTCHLVVPDGTDIVYVDKVETRGTVRMGSRIGNRLPMRNTASGKAIVAFGEPELLDRVLAEPAQVMTEHTITDDDRWRHEVDRTHGRGYGIDDRENEPDIRCVAAPVFDHANQVVGAMSISGLASRFPAAAVRELGDGVVRTAHEISVALGSSSAQLALARGAR
ncbi:IclR family transcriptional regulator [Curtobacterium sp. PhB25]|uniref:IclR family transcriptional regulator n=1 Tax=Bacteria TaxID=2 RepID=UPI001042F80F|nr:MULTISPECIES: IclR family transcriptional regulator [unclassified Curtobacterium]MBF4585521.1 IclR family transcriptional regulator [Curtobacterium sp. VKM Ac-2887]TCU85308.1 IclR family transcriptional regulator [Curtobacterium sp. PhB191]TDW46824.1 IclR family transcriptional regulator [Curtobacterium sp. PhB42]TDW57148.1 IclR family transcriptional regulator [Curtobacterium sp. PhB190]TDW71608.1 IclR family transcriptional regulator [Curtobacterium sp. PhB25]